MGLTSESNTKNSLSDLFNIEKKADQYVVALAGNPNTGKSTVFNCLTGMNQHTGNWPGKTVVNARGKFNYKDNKYILVDVPGTYSLFASSEEEIVARDFICFGNLDAVIVVTDATCLERNLNLVFQIMELSENVILVVNLIDEAKKKHIKLNKIGIEYDLGIPVVFTSARSKIGLDKLKNTLDDVINKNYKYDKKVINYSDDIEEKVKLVKQKLENKIEKINHRWLALRIIDGDERFFESMERYLSIDEISLINQLRNYIVVNKEEIREKITEISYREAEKIKKKHIHEEKDKYLRDRKIDNIITSKKYGLPLMLALLSGILYLTIIGANYPSKILGEFLFKFEAVLSSWFNYFNFPDWCYGVFIHGMYRTLAWVVSVMLPPMAIFFPLFTLLEDLGYLPRVAYNLDHLFKKACAHGKQCLSMCMGFGCNAAGVIGTRIIDSPREKLIAILTNNFVPCNGRFPTLIAISSVFFTVLSIGKFNSIIPALVVTGLIIIGIIVTLIVSYLLSKTILKGVPSTFTLELPPYRKPKIGRVIYTSIIDRTMFVLIRAVVVAIPAGILTWIVANIYVGDLSLLQHAVHFLDPFAKILGLDGYILLAFILGFPANEIVIPILLMAYLSTGQMIEFDSLDSFKQILLQNGWTYLTALNVMLFSLLHWPCSTTLWTIKKETKSWKWTFAGFMIPTIVAITVCITTAGIYRFIF